jgi:hypothetical protein
MKHANLRGPVALAGGTLETFRWRVSRHSIRAPWPLEISFDRGHGMLIWTGFTSSTRT